jgi:hypothetical protein
MKRNNMIILAAVVVVAIAVTVGIIILNNAPPQITINYTYLSGKQALPDPQIDYNGSEASWVVFTLNATSTKDVAVFDLVKDFTVTSNGQPLTVIKVDPSQTTLYSDKFSEGKVGFVVEGDVTTFELVYTGTADVTIMK